MTGIARLASSDALIYVAGRLFDIDEKIKSELLEEAVLAGVSDAAAQAGLEIARRPTFVPFRDAGQEELVVDDKTRQLFQLDIGRLGRTVLLVSYVDGLAKDEGVCFEIGYAFGVGVPILLVSTDFFWLELPSGEEVPFDPLLVAAASDVIRQPQLVTTHGRTFRETLEATRAQVLTATRGAVCRLLLQQEASISRRRGSSPGKTILADFGGGVFEWQRILLDQLLATASAAGVSLRVTHRYDEGAPAADAARADIEALAHADILITCTDGDEAPSGTAFLQGVATALGCPVWMYSSKRTWIRAARDYRSSRNLMLDYSATRVFRSLDDLALAIGSL